MAKRAAVLQDRSLPRPPTTSDFLAIMDQVAAKAKRGVQPDPFHGSLIAEASKKKKSGADSVVHTALARRPSCVPPVLCVVYPYPHTPNAMR